MVEGQALERVQSQLQPAHPSPFAGVGTGHGLTAVRTRLGGRVYTYLPSKGPPSATHPLLHVCAFSEGGFGLQEPESSAQHSYGLCRVSACSQGSSLPETQSPLWACSEPSSSCEIAAEPCTGCGRIPGPLPFKGGLGPPPSEQLLLLPPTLHCRQT